MSRFPAKLPSVLFRPRTCLYETSSAVSVCCTDLHLRRKFPCTQLQLQIMVETTTSKLSSTPGSTSSILTCTPELYVRSKQHRRGESTSSPITEQKRRHSSSFLEQDRCASTEDDGGKNGENNPLPHYVVLALGSNEGPNRVRHLEAALRDLGNQPGIQLQNTSSLYESRAQPKFVEKAKSSATTNKRVDRGGAGKVIDLASKEEEAAESGLPRPAALASTTERSTTSSCNYSPSAASSPKTTNTNNYLNACCSLLTSLTPTALLEVLLDVERRGGRRRRGTSEDGLGAHGCDEDDLHLRSIQNHDNSNDDRTSSGHLQGSVLDQKDEKPNYIPPARTVDLDILLFDDDIVNISKNNEAPEDAEILAVARGDRSTKPREERDRHNVSRLDLQIPHPRMLLRDFVLVPLQELLRADRREHTQHPVTKEVLCALPMPDGARGPSRFLPGLGTLAGANEAWLMGILNTTPDSFSDGGLYVDAAVALQRAEEMRAQGCHIVDVGGESSRPGAEHVAREEELERVVPVYEKLGEKGIPFSADTRKAAVARRALQCGAVCVNDIEFGGYSGRTSVFAGSGGENKVDEIHQKFRGRAGGQDNSSRSEKNDMFALLSDGIRNVSGIRGGLSNRGVVHPSCSESHTDEKVDSTRSSGLTVPESDEFFYIGMHMRGDFKSMDFLTNYGEQGKDMEKSRSCAANAKIADSSGGNTATPRRNYSSDLGTSKHVGDVSSGGQEVARGRGGGASLSLVVAHLNEFFEERLRVLFRNYDVPPWRVVCDPGLGFAKTPEQSLEIVRHARELWRPVQCFGHSRKRFVSFAQGSGAQWHASGKQTLPGNLALTCALAGKVDFQCMFRVHDVQETQQALVAFAHSISSV
ncbi:unnamed protein product [Amoebophrya sp. A120]|nr:unnamed protein product [Amoebophrya sp. A120]|eukprot:GSA120T00000877001.1